MSFTKFSIWFYDLIMSQRSISSFFKTSLSQDIVAPRSDVIELLDSSDGEVEEVEVEEVEVKQVEVKQVEIKQVEAKQVNVQSKAAEFCYNKSSISNTSEETNAVRQQFKRKLNQISFFNPSTPNIENSDQEEEQAPKKKNKKSKLTPLEEQVKSLKLSNMDKVLAVQVGYKYKFFCEDAVKVSKILNIMLLPGKINLINETPDDLSYNKLAYCSIPEPRLHIHLQRLLDNGLKVGVVDQIESSSIKTVESGSSGLFKRKITNVFTKATYVEFDEKNSVGMKDDKKADSIIALSEENNLITLISFQPLTGKIIYDEFQDPDTLKTELKTRLSHLEPLEFLYFDNDLSKESNKVIQQLNLHNNLRIIKYPLLKKAHYLEILNNLIDDSIVEFMFTKSNNFKLCCALLIEYLKEFKLDPAFNKLSNFIPFKETNSMLINSNTLENLEILENSTNNQQFGSLIWVLDHTRTKFGYRLLKTWILNPLIDIDKINKRLDSVEEIKENFNHFLENIANNVLKKSQDLEKTLNRLNYLKIKRKELYLFLEKFNELEQIIIKFGKQEIIDRFKSIYLKEIFENLIEKILKLNPNGFSKFINSQYALDQNGDDHILKYFNMNYLSEFINIDDLLEQENLIKSVENELNSELQEIRSILKRPQVEFVKKQNEPYLIEIRNTQIKSIPKDWVKINSTKTISRFRTPLTNSLHQKLKYNQEIHLNILHEIFDRFIVKLNEKYEDFSIIISQLATLDCLLSLTAVSSNLEYSRPLFSSSTDKKIYLENSRNPIIETLNPSNSIVPNTIRMDNESSHLIITGPNMGGKSSLVKQVALVQIMAQIGCFIPASPDSVVTCFNKILTRMGAKDDLIKGESTFYIEMSQVSKILKELDTCNGNALVILDEVGRGTSTIDGISIAESILEYMLLNKKISENTFVLFITHFPSICKLKEKYSKIENYHMSFIEHAIKSKIENNETIWPTITFLYELKKGASLNSYGLNVANLAGIDKKILNNAYLKSKERQKEVEFNKKLKLLNEVKELLNEENDDDQTNRIESILQLIE